MRQQSVFKSGEGKNEILSFYNKLLCRWVTPNEQRLINTRYGKTFVISCGHEAAAPMVLLHGTGSNSAMWIADVQEYSKNYRVYAVDIIGECGKSSENRPSWNCGNYSDWLLDVFNGLQIANAVLLGCSLGGWIATEFTCIHPEKVNKLVLLSTAGITQVKVSSIILIMLTSLFGGWGFRKINKMVYGKLEIDSDTLTFASLVKEYFIPRTDVLPLFKDEQLQKIEMPVLFIGGDNDCFYNSAGTARRLSSTVKNAECRVMKDTGHVLTNTAEIIMNFFKGHEEI